MAHMYAVAEEAIDEQITTEKPVMEGKKYDELDAGINETGESKQERILKPRKLRRKKKALREIKRCLKTRRWLKTMSPLRLLWR